MSESTIGADLLATVIRNRTPAIRSGLVAAALTATFVLSRGRDWTAEAKFVMQESSGANGLLALAAQYGLGGGASESGQGSAFYADFVTTDGTLRRVLARSVTPGPSRADTSLLSYLEIDSDDPERRVALGVRELRTRISSRASSRTSVVTVGVTMDSPDVAQQVVVSLLEEIGQYSTRTRQSQAVAQREFTGARLRELTEELRRAEERLAAFVVRNRGYAGDPELQLQWQRLSREVDGRNQLVLVLSQAFEQSKIDAVRDTPTITIVSPPLAPGLPDRRGLVTKALLALLVGSALQLTWRSIRRPKGSVAMPLEEELAELGYDLRHPIRWGLTILGRKQTARSTGPE